MNPLRTMMVLAVLAGCSAHTSVQSTYNNERDDCQELAELKLPLYVNEKSLPTPKERNAKLVALFSDCMFQKGWTVATPSRAAEFKADPGVGVGASIKPGRDFRPDSQKDAAPVTQRPRPAPVDRPPFTETPDALDDGPGVVTRKVPGQNPQ